MDDWTSAATATAATATTAAAAANAGTGTRIFSVVDDEAHVRRDKQLKS